MTDEEIKQNALDYRNHTKESGETIVEASRRQLAFEAGAHSRDEEIAKMQEELIHLRKALSMNKFDDAHGDILAAYNLLVLDYDNRGDLIQDLEKELEKWISVKDRLPDEGDDVLICNWAGKVIRNEYVGKGDIKYMKDHPELYTSWMPVQKPQIKERRII